MAKIYDFQTKKLIANLPYAFTTKENKTWEVNKKFYIIAVSPEEFMDLLEYIDQREQNKIVVQEGVS